MCGSSREPRSRPLQIVTLKSLLGTRLIFNVDDGDVNILDISKSSFAAYDLGGEARVDLAQEFKRDFVAEIEENIHDSIEVTLERGTQRMMSNKLDNICGPDDEQYWQQCEVERQQMYVDVYLEFGGDDALDQKEGRITPDDGELERNRRALVTDNKISKWFRRGSGLCHLHLRPRQAAIHEDRHLRWTAVTLAGKWCWLEKGGPGRLQSRTELERAGQEDDSRGVPGPHESRKTGHTPLTRELWTSWLSRVFVF